MPFFSQDHIRLLSDTCECSRDGLDTKMFPFEHECDWHRAARAVCYAIFLFYLFIGVALFSDIFMGSIEEITSKTKKVRIDGQKVEVKVWNDTVANLSLMALGSSAPEILLSTVELMTSGVKVGELGPATIVGSASFNLFMISGICTMSVDLKSIKETGVFALTASVSLFAYAWLVFILVVTSPNRVQVWEGVLTFLFFPALLWLSYRADKHRLSVKALANDGRALARQASTGLFGGKFSSNLKGPAQHQAQQRAKQHQRTAKVDTAESLPKPVEPDLEKAANSSSPRLEDQISPGKRRWNQLSEASSPRVSAADSDCSAASQSLHVLRKWGGMTEAQKTALKFEEMKLNHAMVRAGHRREHLAAFTAAKRTARSPAQVAAAPDTDTGAKHTAPEPAQESSAQFNPMKASSTLNLDLPENGQLRDEALNQIEEAENYSWCGNIKDSLLVNGGEGGASPQDYILHIISVGWKFLAALLPPPHIGDGYPCFIVSIMALGLIVFIIEEVASTFACLIGLSNSVAAITIVALGTSLPDTFASRSAAMGDKYADASIGNVTGSNSVNVFLGIGLPWMIGAIYWTVKGEDGIVIPETGLPFAVFTYLGFAVIALAIFAVRRRTVGGELGGNGKVLVGLVFMLLWVIHVTLSSLNAENIIKANIKS